MLKIFQVITQGNKRMTDIPYVIVAILVSMASSVMRKFLVEDEKKKIYRLKTGVLI